MLKPVLALLLLALWLGAASLVATAVAPAAFAVLPTRALAGALVGRVLPVVFWSGILAGTVAAALAWMGRGTGPAVAHATLRTVAALVTVAACAVAQLGLAPRIARLREQVGPALDALTATDPLRVQFGRLHGISVLCMGAGMLAATVAIVLTLLALRART